MAPEQFLGQAVSATDLYGLGATVLFLLTHRSPSDLPQDRLKISFRSRIQVSEGFADWLEKMLEPDAEDRFSSGKEALEVLRGRRVVSRLKLRRPLPWKACIGVGVAAVAAVSVLNSFKWGILTTFGFSPIGICDVAESGNSNVIRDYLKQGGDPDAKDDERLVLNCASRSGNKTVVELLLAEGADVNRRDNQGMTPLHWAASREVAELLIANGADVNVRDNDGITPLNLAASNYRKDVVELLIAKGADISASNNQSEGLFRWAVLNGWKDVAEQLIAKGADVNSTTQQGETLLFQAVAYGKKDIVKWLIAKGADVNARPNYGGDPFSVVVMYGWKDVAELMIAKGADVNGYGGGTPLHEAARTGRKDLVKLLIAKGADVNVRDRSGKTPLSYAIAKHHWDVIELLESYGGIR
jgi:ankyrin repeat protein